MNTLCFGFLVYSLAVLTVHEATIICRGRIGKSCSRTINCCDGYCLDGTCSELQELEPTKELEPACEDLACSPGEVCISTCTFFEIFCNTWPICLVQAIPDDPCMQIKCAPGYQCQYVPLNCLVAPCPESKAECVLQNPCATTTCPKGFECSRSNNDPTVAECNRIGPCKSLVCPINYEYSPVLERCVAAPCSNTLCRNGYDCVPRTDDPTRADCVARGKDVCEGVQCLEGFSCQIAVMVDHCVEDPCTPIIYAECVPDYFN